MRLRESYHIRQHRTGADAIGGSQQGPRLRNDSSRNVEGLDGSHRRLGRQLFSFVLVIFNSGGPQHRLRHSGGGGRAEGERSGVKRDDRSTAWGSMVLELERRRWRSAALT